MAIAVNLGDKRLFKLENLPTEPDAKQVKPEARPQAAPGLHPDPAEGYPYPGIT
jgi:hypothetical protein